MKNGDSPAHPMWTEDMPIQGTNGLTKRELFCLHTGVPETGDPELDEIIRRGKRKKLAGLAMQGLLARPLNLPQGAVISYATEYADALLKELEK